MINKLVEFIHHLFDPHCPECEECKTCVILREQINAERQSNKNLIQAIIDINKPQKIEQIEPEIDYRQVRKTVPWKVRREMMEGEDKVKAQRIREQAVNQNKSVEEIEKELGINKEIEEGIKDAS